MKKLILLTSLCLFGWMTLYAQVTVSGTVKDADGSSLPGASVVIKGTTTGVVSDIDGNYSISAPENATLVFSYVGLESIEVAVNGRNNIDVVMQSTVLEEVVVTGLGVSREKKSLGYAVTELDGDEVSTVKQQNLVSSLSGKISGVLVRQNNNFGGSTNIIIRGNSSLFQGNQPLFVVDGVPVAGSTFNSSAQRQGREAYDYGSALSDINADDIANINVLKGAAATAIYGSRGANGVVMITTKKANSFYAPADFMARGLGISINSGFTIGKIDKETFIEYQKDYGAGYGAYYGSTGYFDDYDVDGDGTDDLVVPIQEDASYGGKLDGQLVYHWDSFVPESSNYLKQYPYTAAQNTPADFFETEIGFNNNIALYGGNESGNFRLSYTNYNVTGILPNSKLNRNTVSFTGDYKIHEKLLAGVSTNLSFQSTIGRNSTGYSGNLTSQFRQWWQVNVDIKDQEKIFKQTGKNYSWNHTAIDSDGSVLKPIFWDNPYWTRYKNYQSDDRTRFFGNIYLTYEFNDWLKFTGRVSVDSYAELREERRAVGSVAGEFGVSSSGSLTGARDEVNSGYYRINIDYNEINYELLSNFNKTFDEDYSLTGLVGISIRDQQTDRIYSSTSGGLVVADLYALSNSSNLINFPIERLIEKKMYSLFGQVSFGYKNFLFLDLTDRVDKTSTLPSDNNSYNYYSASTSFLFSELLKADISWLNFGKLRLSYAEVGNDTDPLNVSDVFNRVSNYNGKTLYTYPNSKRNKSLEPERTSEWEVGLELSGLNNRVGLDVSLYKRVTEDMLLPVDVSTATGFAFNWVNAAEVENKGIEVGIKGTPLKFDNFSWDINFNWTLNKNLVKDLYNDLANIVLRSYQGSVTLNATKGEPLGQIRGLGFVYDDDGNKVINSSGYYMAQADQIIGDQNPLWNAGITNTFKYKDLSLQFLIDIQKGGDLYSLDMHYGQGTGLTPNTVGNNDLGNPKRNTLADGGGVILDGVKLANSGEDLTYDANGRVTNSTVANDTRARADYFGGVYYWGNNSRNPGALTVYDASFVKLRELSITYNLPKKFYEKFARNVSLSFVGKNLWLIHKNVPYADPESGLSAGLSQGYLVGSYPTVRSFGFNIKVDF